MGKKIKLIWDFRGPQAAETARHFEHHLKESPLFYPELPTGVERLSEMHSFAFLVVGETEMPAFRDALKPHRGTLVD
ncbi:hypothetical protein [Robiginitalea aurantiaca]|uniref:Uncharacterized protein n=1 Tax=Robiginitalea aurantiaca TaxID=3056915 RepID=A0ABT7WCU3_9FLAO|nr:hypothetical protein [Robiginitalea aurantiaca]MDM9630736.1 hypothetical protein [Robiginitalea aurantiaca]